MNASWKLEVSNMVDLGVWMLNDVLVGVAVGLGKFQSALLICISEGTISFCWEGRLTQQTLDRIP